MEVYRNTWNIYSGLAGVLALVFAVFFLVAVFRIRVLCALGFGLGSVIVLVCEFMPDRFQESFILGGVFIGSGAGRWRAGVDNEHRGRQETKLGKYYQLTSLC